MDLFGAQPELEHFLVRAHVRRKLGLQPVHALLARACFRKWHLREHLPERTRRWHLLAQQSFPVERVEEWMLLHACRPT